MAGLVIDKKENFVQLNGCSLNGLHQKHLLQILLL